MTETISSIPVMATLPIGTVLSRLSLLFLPLINLLNGSTCPQLIFEENRGLAFVEKVFDILKCPFGGEIHSVRKFRGKLLSSDLKIATGERFKAKRNDFLVIASSIRVSAKATARKWNGSVKLEPASSSTPLKRVYRSLISSRGTSDRTRSTNLFPVFLQKVRLSLKEKLEFCGFVFRPP